MLRSQGALLPPKSPRHAGAHVRLPRRPSSACTASTCHAHNPPWRRPHRPQPEPVGHQTRQPALPLLAASKMPCTADKPAVARRGSLSHLQQEFDALAKRCTPVDAHTVHCTSQRPSLFGPCCLRAPCCTCVHCRCWTQPCRGPAGRAAIIGRRLDPARAVALALPCCRLDAITSVLSCGRHRCPLGPASITVPSSYLGLFT